MADTEALIQKVLTERARERELRRETKRRQQRFAEVASKVSTFEANGFSAATLAQNRHQDNSSARSGRGASSPPSETGTIRSAVPLSLISGVTPATTSLGPSTATTSILSSGLKAKIRSRANSADQSQYAPRQQLETQQAQSEAPVAAKPPLPAPTTSAPLPNPPSRPVTQAAMVRAVSQPIQQTPEVEEAKPVATVPRPVQYSCGYDTKPSASEAPLPIHQDRPQGLPSQSLEEFLMYEKMSIKATQLAMGMAKEDEECQNVQSECENHRTDSGKFEEASDPVDNQKPAKCSLPPIGKASGKPPALAPAPEKAKLAPTDRQQPMPALKRTASSPSVLKLPQPTSKGVAPTSVVGETAARASGQSARESVRSAAPRPKADSDVNAARRGLPLPPSSAPAKAERPPLMKGRNAPLQGVFIPGQFNGDEKESKKVGFAMEKNSGDVFVAKDGVQFSVVRSFVSTQSSSTASVESIRQAIRAAALAAKEGPTVGKPPLVPVGQRQGASAFWDDDAASDTSLCSPTAARGTADLNGTDVASSTQDLGISPESNPLEQTVNLGRVRSKAPPAAVGEPATTTTTSTRPEAEEPEDMVRIHTGFSQEENALLKALEVINQKQKEHELKTKVHRLRRANSEGPPLYPRHHHETAPSYLESYRIQGDTDTSDESAPPPVPFLRGKPLVERLRNRFSGVL